MRHKRQSTLPLDQKETISSMSSPVSLCSSIIKTEPCTNLIAPTNKICNCKLPVTIHRMKDEPKSLPRFQSNLSTKTNDNQPKTCSINTNQSTKTQLFDNQPKSTSESVNNDKSVAPEKVTTPSPSTLPKNIPTLESLSQTSPKLSTWRQTRIISEKLEQHLWTWRCACKKSGKRISKSLLQARAKWAFRKAGIVEFKASDGWYWKWLSKWRRRGEELGITEQGDLSKEELEVLPSQSVEPKTEVKEEKTATEDGGTDIKREAEDDPDNGEADNNQSGKQASNLIDWHKRRLEDSPTGCPHANDALNRKQMVPTFWQKHSGHDNASAHLINLKQEPVLYQNKSHAPNHCSQCGVKPAPNVCPSRPHQSEECCSPCVQNKPNKTCSCQFCFNSLERHCCCSCKQPNTKTSWPATSLYNNEIWRPDVETSRPSSRLTCRSNSPNSRLACRSNSPSSRLACRSNSPDSTLARVNDLGCKRSYSECSDFSTGLEGRDKTLSLPSKMARTEEDDHICSENNFSGRDWDSPGSPASRQAISFVPLEPLCVSSNPYTNLETTLDQLIPNKKIAVSEILPLTLYGNEIGLASNHTDCNLPVSPIFIKTLSQNNNNSASQCEESRESGESCSDPNCYSHKDHAPSSSPFSHEYHTNKLLDNLDDLPLDTELLEFSGWQGDIDIIDTDQLVNSLYPPDIDDFKKSPCDASPLSSGQSLFSCSDSPPSCSDTPPYSQICDPSSDNLPSSVLFSDSDLCTHHHPHQHHCNCQQICANTITSKEKIMNLEYSEYQNLSSPDHPCQVAPNCSEFHDRTTNLVFHEKSDNPCPVFHEKNPSACPVLHDKTVVCPSWSANLSPSLQGQQLPNTQPISQTTSPPKANKQQDGQNQCRNNKEPTNKIENKTSSTKGENNTKEESIDKKKVKDSAKPVPKQQLTVIAIHKKKGEESLNKFKEEVRKFAVDHTFKETAKRFGIHHSTVSGWVKECEKLENCATGCGDLCREKGDDMFISWLKERRESGAQVTLSLVKTKVGEILSLFGQQDIEKTCKWFLLWHNRREEKLYVEGMEDEDMKKETQNLAYPPAFKLEVALFAKRHSQYAAAKIFNVARRRIFDWMRQIPKLEELIAKGHMKKMTGRGPKNRDIDQALYSWYCERKSRGNRPKSCHVQSKARELYLTYGYSDMKCSYGWFKRWSQRFQIQLRYSYDDEIIEWIISRFDENLPVTAQDLQNHGLSLIKKEDPSFKASSGWALRFCKRHREYLSCDDTFSCRLPPHLESRVNTFRQVLAQLHKEKKFSADRVGAVDELPLHFQLMAEKKTTCVLRQPGMDTAHSVVILAVTADGQFLPPFVVFKAETIDGDKNTGGGNSGETAEGEGGDGEENMRKEDTSSDDGVMIRGSGSEMVEECGCTSPLVLGMRGQGRVGEEEMGKWLEEVWFKNVKHPNFLLADCYNVHTAPTVQKLLLQRDSCLAIIPNACSSKLQPLHQRIKENFKRGIEEKYLNQIRSHCGKPDNKMNPSPQQVMAWTQEVFNQLRQNTEEIAASFRATEIYGSKPGKE